MEEAIEVLKSQETPKYAEVARQFNLSRHTLMRRFKGETLPRAEAVSIHLKALTTAQEHQLISHLNRLSDRGIPATVQITENIVSELVQRPVGRVAAGRVLKSGTAPTGPLRKMEPHRGAGPRNGTATRGGSKHKDPRVLLHK